MRPAHTCAAYNAAKFLIVRHCARLCPGAIALQALFSPIPISPQIAKENRAMTAQVVKRASDMVRGAKSSLRWMTMLQYPMNRSEVMHVMAPPMIGNRQ